MHMLKVNGFMGTPSFLMTLAQRAESLGLEIIGPFLFAASVAMFLLHEVVVRRKL